MSFGTYAISPYDPIPEAPDIAPDVEKGYQALPKEVKDKYCWQHYGYPELAGWMASSKDFLVLRRFSSLQVRSLLYLQHEIATYDKQLRDWDRYAKRQVPPEMGNSGWIDQDPDSLPGQPRPEILRRVVPLLQQYNELVQSFAQLRAKETASDHYTRNIQSWFATYGETAIDPDEQHFRNHNGDVFALESTSRYPLVAFLHRWRWLRRRLKLKGRHDRVDSVATVYHSNVGIEIVATCLTLIIGLGMTFASIWGLNYVQDNVWRLAIITGSGSAMTLLA